MPSDLPKNAIKFLVALLKHQAEQWLGEEAIGIAGETLVEIGGDELQQRLDTWLTKEETHVQLLQAAQRAGQYFNQHCPDDELKQAFSLHFGNLPSVQEALSEFPRVMDTEMVRRALLKALERDIPSLTPFQCEKGARLYTEALLRSVGLLKDFTLPVLLQTLFDLRHELSEGQTEIRQKLDHILEALQQKILPPPASPILPGNLPHGSYLPFPRNAFFTGRVEDLEKLESALLPPPLPGAPQAKEPGKALAARPGSEGEVVRSVVINQAITGMGGIGKTQLAVEFAYQYGYLFRGVHWLDLRAPEALEAQIALCGEKMGLPHWPEKQPDQVAATLRAWQSDDPRLLILDNFEDIEFANAVLARLSHSALHLLITSRRSDWSSALGLRRLPLDEFTPQESRDFLRKYLPEAREADEDLDVLAKYLGHLPLALELAGRYLESQSRLKIRNYLAQLEEALEHPSMQNWKPERKSLTGHDLSLLQTFTLSWEKVKEPLAQRLFIAAGFCAANALIPSIILEAALAEKAADCDEYLGDLVGLGLLKEGPTIHPLLAQFARRMDIDGALLAAFSEAVVELANQTNHEEDRTGNYTLYAPILPHVRAVAEIAEKVGLAAAGSLWNSLGYHISDLADYAGAQAAYERAIKIWEANLGPEHPQVATGVNNLGNVLQDLGDLAGAKAAYERALKIDEAAYGRDHPSVARDVNNLGGVLKALGDLAGAKAAYERALRIFRQFLPPGHPNIEIVRGNLESLGK